MAISFPLWVIRSAASNAIPGTDFACSHSGSLLAFDSAEKAVDYVLAHPHGEDLSIRLLPRNAARLLMADLHEQHVPGVCLNARYATDEGTFLTLDEFVSELQRGA